jgi:hypothetical protein
MKFIDVVCLGCGSSDFDIYEAVFMCKYCGNIKVISDSPSLEYHESISPSLSVSPSPTVSPSYSYATPSPDICT